MIRVDYAGCGGVCEGIRDLGLHPVGIEWDRAACATRAAARHLTIRADLSTYEPHHQAGTVEGYWASPPCQTFSTAGKGEGAAIIDQLAAAIHAERWAEADDLDPRTRHVLDAARVASTIGANWVAMEQVPAVIPLWRALGHVLQRRGYATWSGVLCAADYGVPQTRRRAILMASRTRAVAPPVPTHAQHPGLFGELPWVSMATALGWSGHLDRRQQTDGVPARLIPTHEPAPTLTSIAGSKGQWIVRTRGDSGRTRDEFDGAAAPSRTLTGKSNSWCWEMLATTVAADPRITARCHHDHGTQGADAITTAEVAAGADPGTRPIRLSITDAMTLQAFRPDFPVQGTITDQFQQIGNAVPPPVGCLHRCGPPMTRLPGAWNPPEDQRSAMDGKAGGQPAEGSSGGRASQVARMVRTPRVGTRRRLRGL